MRGRSVAETRQRRVRVQGLYHMVSYAPYPFIRILLEFDNGLIPLTKVTYSILNEPVSFDGQTPKSLAVSNTARFPRQKETLFQKRLRYSIRKKHVLLRLLPARIFHTYTVWTGSL